MSIILRKTKELESEIDAYLDYVVSGALIFREGIKYYLRGEKDLFEERRRRLDDTEGLGDKLRRVIETKLYLQTLIPESRGDVLGLIENSDKVLNRLSDTLINFSIEQPEVPEEVRDNFMDLAGATASSVESMVEAVRVYFRECEKVRDCINRVMFYEKETDKLADKIKRAVYGMPIELARKNHIRNFVHYIEVIADDAEDVCDRLAIASIKRNL